MYEPTPVEKINDEMEVAEYALFSLAELLRAYNGAPLKTEPLGFLVETIARQSRVARYMLIDYEQTLRAA
ncbi:hypothetical protein [Rhodoblastus sp.]|uniref:hypothetical protein n=1 Tax=Rhodoblastus sp. TaxID=1962975 RepID=UPI003F9B3DF0